ncbi:MAG: FAD-dependent oxidoreductase [Alphaproteobacteria bacterium]|nr:FAD-dependent oxidoreductase [Alphaproteobacteria bacterium]
MSNVINDSNIEFDVSVPVIVIGAGAAGLIAALATHDSGTQVLILERDSSPSGSTALSSGLIPACNTRWQNAAKVVDDIPSFVSDIQSKNKKQANEKLVKKVCSISGKVLHWLVDRHDQKFDLVEGFLYPGHSVCRMHCHPKRTGKALIDSLVTAVEKSGIDIITSAIVTDIYVGKNVCVRGIRILRPNGTIENIGCNSIIFACNGYGGNPDMISKYIPEMADALYFGHQGNQGDAINWGLKLGAATEHMGAYQGHGSVSTPHGALITWAIMMEGGIQINSTGKRFSNEHEGYSEQSIKVLQQPNGIAWNIFDERLHQLGLGFEDYRVAVSNGAVKSFASIDKLAAYIDASAEIIASSIKDIEAFTIGKKKCPFGRNFEHTSVLKGPPYYGVKVTGALFHTQGGLLVDTEARVLRQDSSVIPGLFAAGGAAVGVSGAGVEGYLSGNGLLMAVNLGYLAGQSAAKSARTRKRPE